MQKDCRRSLKSWDLSIYLYVLFVYTLGEVFHICVYMEARMLGNMNVIERKKKGVHKAIVSLISELKDFDNLLESPTTCTQILNHLQFEAQKSRQEKSNVGFVERLGLDKNHQLTVSNNPMNEKQKDFDFTEIGEGKLKEMWKKLVCKEREVEGKMKEVEFSKRFVEERAMELELRQKELDDGFRELELKKMEFTNKIAGIKCSYAGLYLCLYFILNAVMVFL